MYYIFLYNNSTEVGEFDLETEIFVDFFPWGKTDQEYYIINNRKFSIAGTYNFINSYIDAETISNKFNNVPIIFDGNDQIIPWITLLGALESNHALNVVDDEMILIVLRKV